MATLAQAQALITAASCNLCTLPPGLASLGLLSNLIDHANGVTPPTTPQGLVDRIGCLSCLSPGLVDYAILATLVDDANGVAVSREPSALADRARCFLCEAASGLLPLLILSAAIRLNAGPLTNAALYEGANCLLCISPGMIPLALLAVLMILSEGGTPPTTPAGLMEQATCLLCIVPVGMIPVLQLEASKTLA